MNVRGLLHFANTRYAAALVVLCAAGAPAPAHAQDPKEDDYVRAHCLGAVEFILEDRSRVDCLTGTHAIEYDFSGKWAESLGQALHYAASTGKEPGIVLICKAKNPVTCMNHVSRLESALTMLQFNVQVELIDATLFMPLGGGTLDFPDIEPTAPPPQGASISGRSTP